VLLLAPVRDDLYITCITSTDLRASSPVISGATLLFIALILSYI